MVVLQRLGWGYGGGSRCSACHRSPVPSSLFDRQPLSYCNPPVAAVAPHEPSYITEQRGTKDREMPSLLTKLVCGQALQQRHDPRGQSLGRAHHSLCSCGRLRAH